MAVRYRAGTEPQRPLGPDPARQDPRRLELDAIADEIRKGQRQLGILLRKAKSTLTALNVELHEEGAERSTPITLPVNSLEQAVSALAANGEVG